MRPYASSVVTKRLFPLVFAVALLFVSVPGCSAGDAVGDALSSQQNIGSVSSADSSSSSLSSEAESVLNIRREEFDVFLEEVNATRKAELERAKAPDLSPYTPNRPERESLLSQEEVEVLLERRETRTVTGPEAAQDVDLLFRLLQTDYGPYDYFGGDEIFLPLRNALWEEVNGYAEVSPETLEEILTRRLSPALQDGHFRIGSSLPIREKSMTTYFVPGLILDSTENLDPALLRPTIGPDGRIASCFAVLSRDGSELPAEVEIGGKRVKLAWKPVENEANMGGPAFLESEEDGVPLLTVRRMYAEEGNPEQESQLGRFASCGSEYHNAPLIFLDLRGNTGGDGQYGAQWLTGFTGIYTRGLACFTMAQKFGPLTKAQISVPPEELSGAWTIESSKGYWCDPKNLGGAGPKYLFVLQDRASASAAESLCSPLRSRADTLFVGSNTAGCYLNGVRDMWLPNSGLSIRAGNSLLLDSGQENIDGRGFLPDLWVEPEDALNAAARLCEYYGLREMLK